MRVQTCGFPRAEKLAGTSDDSYMIERHGKEKERESRVSFQTQFAEEDLSHLTANFNLKTRKKLEREREL